MLLAREAHTIGMKNTDTFKYSMETNATGSDAPELLTGCVHTATLAVCTVLVTFVLFLGCTGNGMALFSALTTKRLRSNSELFVINLAGADFIMCTCLSPIFLFLLFSDSPAPPVFCGSILFLGATSCILSLLSLVVIALHRQLRVSGRLRRPMNLTQASTTVAFVWMISISVALGGMIHSIVTWGRGSVNKCQILERNNDRVENHVVLYFLAPVAVVSIGIIALCYGFIAQNARKLHMYDTVTPHSDNHHNLDEMAIDNCENGHHQRSSLVTNKCIPPGGDYSADNSGNAGTMCFVVTLVIVLCWVPLIMSEFIELATGPSIIIFQVKICGTALVFLNSALNPYLYGQTNISIKDRYAKLLHRVACDITVHRTIKLRKPEVRTLEGCPLRSSHVTSDTNTAQVGAPEPIVKLSNRRDQCFVNRCNNNYAQNILLFQCSNTNNTSRQEIRQKGNDFSVV